MIISIDALGVCISGLVLSLLAMYLYLTGLKAGDAGDIAVTDDATSSSRNTPLKNAFRRSASYAHSKVKHEAPLEYLFTS